MRTTTRVMMASLMAMVSLILAGCISDATGKKSLFVPEPTVVTVVHTNVTQVATPTIVNGVTVTNFQTIVTYETNTVTHTNYVVNPGVTQVISSAKDVAGSTPWSLPISGGLAILSGILAVIAKAKSDKASLLPAVIAGVEAAGAAALPVKQSIQNVATAAGVQDQLNKVVQNLTT